MHIAMINSLNFLTGRVGSDEIINSDCPLFAHHFDDEIEEEEISNMIDYFESIGYEEGVEDIKQVYVNLFVLGNKAPDVGECECEVPIFREYEPYIKCTICEKRVTL